MAGLTDYSEVAEPPVFDQRLQRFPPEDRRLLEDSLGDYLARLGFTE